MALDTAQYQLDMEYMQEHKSEDVYSTFNLLMRRKPKVGLEPQHLICYMKGRSLLACPYGLLCVPLMAHEAASVAASCATHAAQALFNMVVQEQSEAKA